MNETMSAGKRRASVPVDSGSATGGRHRRDGEPSTAVPATQTDQPILGDEPTRRRWFRRR